MWHLQSHGKYTLCLRVRDGIVLSILQEGETSLFLQNLAVRNVGCERPDKQTSGHPTQEIYEEQIHNTNEQSALCLAL